MFGIFCLMVSGGMLPSGADLFLKEQACQLVRNGGKKDFFLSEHFDGMISTELKYAQLSSYARGVVFNAVIESDDGKITVNFILDTNIYQKIVEEDLEWVTVGNNGEAYHRRGAGTASPRTYNA